MFEKNIKKQVNKQLKKNFPNWKKLQKKEKKKIASEALEVAVADYDFSQPTQTNDKSLFGVEEQAPAKGMMTIKEMAQYIKDHNSYKVGYPLDASTHYMLWSPPTSR